RCLPEKAAVRICRTPQTIPHRGGVAGSPRTESALLAWAALRLPPVRRLGRNDPSDAAAWIRHIAFPARNDMNVCVHHRLPGCRAVVDADVEPVRLQSTEQFAACLGH